MSHTRIFTMSMLALSLAGLAGCGGGSSDGGSDRGTDIPTPEPDTHSSQVIDATANDHYTYFNLETSSIVALTDAEAQTSDQWHVAFRRNAIKVNGGASGPGNMAGAVVAEQTDFYDSNGEPNSNVFLNATADSELEHLLADYATPTTFTEETFTTPLVGSGATTGTQMDMGWYWYDFTTHALSANDDNGWLMRSAEGNSYARFRATALSYDRSNGLDVTFTFDVQAAGSSGFGNTATFNAHIDPAGGESCFDFDNNSGVDCESPSWDLKLGVSGRDWYLRSNGGVSGNGMGAAFGPVAWNDLITYPTATTAPDNTSIARLYTQDSTSGIFAEQSWYAYNLDGTHKLHPNYRVYWISDDRSAAEGTGYLLQITGYYDDTGASGHVHLRWRQAN